MSSYKKSKGQITERLLHLYERAIKMGPDQPGRRRASLLETTNIGFLEETHRKNEIKYPLQLYNFSAENLFVLK